MNNPNLGGGNTDLKKLQADKSKLDQNLDKVFDKTLDVRDDIAKSNEIVKTAHEAFISKIDIGRIDPVLGQEINSSVHAFREARRRYDEAVLAQKANEAQGQPTEGIDRIEENLFMDSAYTLERERRIDSIYDAVRNSNSYNAGLYNINPLKSAYQDLQSANDQYKSYVELQEKNIEQYKKVDEEIGKKNEKIDELLEKEENESRSGSEESVEGDGEQRPEHNNTNSENDLSVILLNIGVAVVRALFGDDSDSSDDE